MDASIFITAIMLAIVLGALHSLSQRSSHSSVQDSETDNNMPKENSAFTIRFSENKFSPAMRINPEEDAKKVVETFGLMSPRPALFITGGAGRMTEDDIARTHEIMTEGIAKFAAEFNVTVIDGGTHSGVMQMIGDARKENGYNFPLIGVSPYYKVTYPNSEPIEGAEAELNDGHSHFVLVNTEEWGGESEMIIKITRAVAALQKPMIGVLINGGQIAERDVYYATAIGENRIPILILEGSGRTADNISNAYRTQQTDNKMIKAIIQGGDIRLSSLDQGVPELLKHLLSHFGGA